MGRNPMLLVKKQKAEVLLHGVMHDRTMSSNIKKRIIQVVLLSGISKSDLKYYLDHEKWPEKTSYDPDREYHHDPDREYKVKVRPARVRAAQRNLLVALMIAAIMSFGVAFFVLTNDNETEKTAKSTSTSIEEPRKPIEEGSKL